MLPVQSCSQKYSRSLLTQITSTSLASRPTHKGRFAIVTDVGQGMRWTQAALLTRALSCGRRSRVVLTPRRWRQVGERNFTGDGGKQARSPGRVRRKPLKPSRAGMPGDPGATVVTNACAFYHCARGCGCKGHPAFPTPFVGRKVHAQLGRIAPRECGGIDGMRVTSFRGDAKHRTRNLEIPGLVLRTIPK
jgi:hypothetical protein